MNIIQYNQAAWDQKVAERDRWTVPVDSAAIERARAGRPQLQLTSTKRVPDHWLPDFSGLRVLCLASGGGQQAPLIAAAGANVVSLDLSPAMLRRDLEVAVREHLSLEAIVGEMRQLAMFRDESFDWIFHPCANCFVPEVRPVWNECARVLKPGCEILAGFINPVRYIFDYQSTLSGALIVRHPLPYSDVGSLPANEVERFTEANEPLEYSHSLEDLIGGQTDAGLQIKGLFEDRYAEENHDALSDYLPTMIATRARKT